MDGMDEWRFADAVADADEARYEQQRKVEKKNAYCNTIRDYGKLREIAAKIINALGIKDEDADEVSRFDIKALYVDDSHTTIDIEWTEVIDGGKECQSTTNRIETVPADWFALDESNLRSAIKSYKKQMGELIEGLKRDLNTAIETKKAVDERIAQIKRQLSNLEGY